MYERDQRFLLKSKVYLQLANEAGNEEFRVCVIEKAATVGGHILSGAVIEPRSLNELIPDWQEKGAPLNTPVKSDKFLLLSETGSLGKIRFLCPT